jgi:hypothetical protein
MVSRSAVAITTVLVLLLLPAVARGNITVDGSELNGKAFNSRTSVTDNGDNIVVSSRSATRFSHQFSWRSLPTREIAYIQEWDITPLIGDFGIAIIDEESDRLFAPTTPERLRGELRVVLKSKLTRIIIHANLTNAGPVSFRIKQPNLATKKCRKGSRQRA